MTYSEIVKAWSKSRENYLYYKFEIGDAFTPIYQKIAKELNYYKEDKLNDYMKLYPVEEINEEKMKTSTYSLYGAVTYEKFGWSSLILQINTNDTEIIPQNGIYRFIIYIKKVNEVWYYSIDEAPFEEVSVSGQPIYQQKHLTSYIRSDEADFEEKAMRKIFDSIPSKISWDDEYISDVNTKIKNIQNLFIQHLETNKEKLTPYSKLDKIDTDLGFLSYELNDWTSYSLALLIELKKNTYPKTNYIFTFHLKKKDDNWIIKFDNSSEMKRIDSAEEINEIINDFCKYQDTFDNWLAIGE